MRRKTFDVLVSATGMLLVAVLLIAGGLMTWAHNYVSDEVHDQLNAQKIFFPAADSASISAPEYAPMKKYGGQQLLTGKQAEVYADYFIANHLDKTGGGKTYAELSTQAQSDPTNTELKAKVDTMFKGETLRGLLLNAYAFDTMATIAGYAAITSFVGAGLLLILSVLGLLHSRKAGGSELGGGGSQATVDA
jgi:hypothetical protein